SAGYAPRRAALQPSLRRGGAYSGGLRPAPQPVDQKIDHRRRVERQYLRDEQTADNGNAEWPAQFGAWTGRDGQRDAGEQRGHGRHQDRTETSAAGFENGISRRQAAVTLGLQREIHHHDAVLLDDADQENDADKGDHGERRIGDLQRQQRTKAGDRKSTRLNSSHGSN